MLTEIVGDIEPDHRILPVPALDSPMEKYAAVSDVPEHIGKVTMATKVRISEPQIAPKTVMKKPSIGPYFSSLIGFPFIAEAAFAAPACAPC